MKNHIARYEKESSLQIDVKAFNTKDEIIYTLEHANEYDLLFVDIYMETLNGIDLARQVRKDGVQSRIVFFSTSKDHGIDAFGVNAIQYLIKPVDYASFENAVKIALADKLRHEESIKISADNELVTINLDSFVYSEAQRNYQYIYLADGSLQRTRMSCKRLYEMLQSRYEFVKLGASFIINLDYVTRISSKTARLKDGKEIPVPRGSFALLKQQYVDFYMKGGVR